MAEQESVALNAMAEEICKNLNNQTTNLLND